MDAVFPARVRVDDPAFNVKLVVVTQFHGVPLPVLDMFHAPFPIFRVRVAVPVEFNAAAAPESVTLLLLMEKSRMQPVVEAVHALIVMEITVTFVLTVMVHVVPPTQVLASKITVSTLLGTDAPVAPPVVVDHIAVLDPSHVHVVEQMPKRFAASAGVKQANSNATRIRKRNALIAYGPPGGLVDPGTMAEYPDGAVKVNGVANFAVT